MGKFTCQCEHCRTEPAVDWDCHVKLIRHDFELLFPKREYGVVYDEQTDKSKVYISHTGKDFRLTIPQLAAIAKSRFHITNTEITLVDYNKDDYGRISAESKIKTVIYLEKKK